MCQIIISSPKAFRPLPDMFIFNQNTIHSQVSDEVSAPRNWIKRDQIGATWT